ncbi:MAG: M13 family metallopeptidase, partial [Saprospiraceae bacterium]
MQKLAFLIFLLIINDSCKNEVKINTENIAKKDILAENMDTSLSPGEDIFEYINGQWLKNNPIPAEEVNWGIGNLIIEENNLKLRKICEDASSQTSPSGSIKQKIGDFWIMAMDSGHCEMIGMKPLENYIVMIDQITDSKSLIATLAELSEINANSLINVNVTQDDKNSEKMALYFYQGGLGLPDRDYYFNNDQRTKKIRAAYPAHIAKMLGFLQYDSLNSQKYSKDIFSLETSLAKYSRKLEDLRDPYKNYNAIAYNSLKKLGKNIDWSLFFTKSKISTDTCIFGQPEYYRHLDQLFSQIKIEVWKAYLKWHLINSYATTLNKEVAEEHFNFYNKLIQGAEIQKPRWKRSLDAIDNSLGELLGQEFIKNYFDEKAKLRYNNLVESIREVFKEHIQKLEWMNISTKQKALVKLASMSKKVGFPDKWKDLSAMKIGRNSYCENEINANKFWINYNRSKLGKPVDRTVWDMTPQTYNAYYNPSNNEIVLPAAIFSVPGFKDEELDDALVYGYTAASTIGHEITHGFDDQGRQYDEKGNLLNWWTKEDELKFNS